MEASAIDQKRLKMHASAYREVVWNAETAWPRECCGALLGRWIDGQEIVCEAMPAVGANTATGRDFFRIGTQDMVAFHARALRNGWRILGFFHSHPDGTSVPSRADLPKGNEDGAAQDGATWPEHCLLIVGVQSGKCHGVGAYRLTTDTGAGDNHLRDLRYEALELEIIAADRRAWDDAAGK